MANLALLATRQDSACKRREANRANQGLRATLLDIKTRRAKATAVDRAPEHAHVRTIGKDNGCELVRAPIERSGRLRMDMPPLGEFSGAPQQR